MKKWIWVAVALILGGVFIIDLTGAYSVQYLFKPQHTGHSALKSVYIDADGLIRCTDQSNVVHTVAFLGDAVQSFGAGDATPSVADYAYFRTTTGAIRYTDFDDGEAGQIITIVHYSKDTLDVTSTDLKGGTTDIICDSLDVSVFISNGRLWYLIGRLDMSDDIN